MKKIVLILLVLFCMVAILWWLGGSENKEDSHKQTEPLETTYKKKEIPEINVDRIIESYLENIISTSTASTENNLSNDGTVRLFTENDLIIAPQSPEISAQYKQIMLVLIKQIENKEPSEAEAMINAFNSNNSLELNTIKENELFFKDLNLKLLDIAVPENNIENHLALLSHTEKIRDRLVKMQLILSDPLTAMKNAQLYHIEIALLSETLKKTRSYLNSLKVQ